MNHNVKENVPICGNNKTSGLYMKKKTNLFRFTETWNFDFGSVI